MHHPAVAPGQSRSVVGCQVEGKYGGEFFECTVVDIRGAVATICWAWNEEEDLGAVSSFRLWQYLLFVCPVSVYPSNYLMAFGLSRHRAWVAGQRALDCSLGSRGRFSGVSWK
eukprot:938857-Pyramimonas_sp.AAC.1